MDLGKKWEWVDTSNKTFNEALDLILNTDRNLVILGTAGSGKSVLLKIAKDKLYGNTVVLSSTGVSAANLVDDGIEATTIHSFFSLKPYQIFPKTVELQNYVANRVKKVNTFLIDEVSMVSSNLLDYCFRLVNEYKKHSSKTTRYILFGDVLQFAPVIDSSDNSITEYYQTEYEGETMFFASRLYYALLFKTINLSAIYRQSEKNFIEALNHIRIGKPTDEDLTYLNSRVMSLNDYKKDHKLFLYLCTTNNKVTEMNRLLCKSTGKQQTYKATIEGNFKETAAMSNRRSITIGIGMQVMCIKNSNDADNKFVNGTLGKVIDVDPTKVTIQKEDDSIITVGEVTWNQYEYSYDSSHRLLDKTPKLKGSFTQIGCVPAAAITIHKSQSLTLENVYIDLNGYIQKGMAYIALSRCKNLKGIGLAAPLTRNNIIVNENAIEYLKENNLELV